MMIYKSKMAGPYHIENGLPCQDAYAIARNDTFDILAVADGLGSELHSDIGADVAAQTAASYCAEHLAAEVESAGIRSVMNNAFVRAYEAVLERVIADRNDSDEYDTTLCLAAYDGEHLYYGQSGDSGLVALLQNGEYRRITTQQRDEEGRVYPLCSGPDKWEFGSVDSPVSAFMLMTDGVFEQICPKLMQFCDIDINIPLVRHFLDHFDVAMEDVPELEKAVNDYLEHYPADLLDDDKTVAALINPERVPAEREASYYAAPDWEALFEEAKRRLFPAACPDAQEETEPISSQNTGEDSAPVRSQEGAGDGEPVQSPDAQEENDPVQSQGSDSTEIPEEERIHEKDPGTKKIPLRPGTRLLESIASAGSQMASWISDLRIDQTR